MMTQVAIGLGSNLGDRAANLRAALEMLGAFMQALKCSSFIETPALLPPDAPPEWDRPFLNAVAVGETALLPQELLAALQAIERQMGRQKLGVWSPRNIDLDILLYGEEVIEREDLVIPHPQMLLRDFVMQPLKEVAGDWLHPVVRRRIADIEKTKLMGIVNVTPDSFSDGGEYAMPQQAVEQVRRLFAQGAAWVDIGAESTRPGAQPVNAAEEWARLQPVLEGLRDVALRLSIDTRHGETAARALALGVGIINDVSGAADEALLRAVAAHPQARYVLMHSLTVPADKATTLPEDVDVVVEIMSFAQAKLAQLKALGILRDRVIFDVGLGFGKTQRQNEQLVERIAEFHALGVPLLVGHSRKSFLAAAPEMRDAATLEISRQLAAAGVDILRVHNIEAHHGL